jgi:hypothetical protein
MQYWTLIRFNTITNLFFYKDFEFFENFKDLRFFLQKIDPSFSTKVINEKEEVTVFTE